MAPRLKQTLSKSHKEGIRAAALARHAARREAGLPSFAGLPYAAPVVDAPVVAVALPPTPVVAVPRPVPQPVRVLLRDDGTPVPPKPVVVPPEVPRPPVDPAPRLAFEAWLRGPVGRQASDPRMSREPSRMGAELDDRLWTAWQAGVAAGAVGPGAEEGTP